MPIDFYRRSNGTFRSECKVCSDATTTRNRLRRLSGELPVVVPEVKTCCRCKVTKPHTAFHRHAGKPDGLHVACKACRAAGGRRSKYGISQSEFDELLVRQTGRCAICSEPMPRPAVDHCHTVGAVRGLLCSPCNTGLGHFKDSPARLLAAIQYLGYALGNNHQPKEPAMSEPTSTTSEPTVAEKRAALQKAGVAVGTRGKLSAENEARYQELRANGQA